MPKQVAVIRTLLYVGDEDRVHETLARSPKLQPITAGPRLSIRELSRQDVTLDLLAIKSLPSVLPDFDFALDAYQAALDAYRNVLAAQRRETKP